MDPKEFCKYCDKGPNGIDSCSKGYHGNQERYSRRERCGWSHIEGVWVCTTKETIEIQKTEEKIPRSDIQRLTERIRVQAGIKGIKKPEISPLEKISA